MNFTCHPEAVAVHLKVGCGLASGIDEIHPELIVRSSLHHHNLGWGARKPSHKVKEYDDTYRDPLQDEEEIVV